MNNNKQKDLEDDLLPEYDLQSLKVRRFGSERKSFAGKIVRLDDDVAEVFPDAEAVNQALRSLIKARHDN
ncbi:hypothetical protein Pse7367_3051 [Thalassoporum mexicanum PCC 7367]|uniref:hypothetical protein n=1 Tax=Thalassoporum mexicanum TaxID=3457544 RepID=UPI00029FC82A|nr:hypothetical protein [Pseudanabaena sp. PCC 7367]AFY71300.1 hypothetical protein Pse7367_3051 [Pseudanabaena sp. PCC 7367]